MFLFLVDEQSIRVAAQALARIQRAPDTPFAFPLLFHYQMGWSAYLSFQFDRAAGYFVRMLNMDSNQQRQAANTIRVYALSLCGTGTAVANITACKAFYAYQIALSYLTSGHYTEGHKIMSTVAWWVPKANARPIELFAKRKAEQFLQAASTCIIEEKKGSSGEDSDLHSVSVQPGDTCVDADTVLDTYELMLYWHGFSQMRTDVLQGMTFEVPMYCIHSATVFADADAVIVFSCATSVR